MLVQEQDELDIFQVPVVDEGLEDFAGLFEAICLSVLAQVLVVLAGRGDEENGRDVREALVPLLTLCPLASDVNELKWHRSDLHFYFGYSCCGTATSQDVRRVRHVVFVGDLVDDFNEVGHILDEVSREFSFEEK